MILPLQLPLRPALPNVYGSLDFQEQRSVYMRIDLLLRESGIEESLVRQMLADREMSSGNDKLVARMFNAIRCCVAMRLCGLGYREFSARLADSNLLQWFTFCGDYGVILPPSKSTLQRYSGMVELSELENSIDALTLQAAHEDPEKRLGALDDALDLGDVFADCTCVKANIHFPTDWVLLIDAVRTLMQAITLIRRHGLRHRMPEPEHFIRNANTLAMAMSANRRAKDSRRNRKKILRKLKKLSRSTQSHAERYRDLLDREWEQTDWTRKQAEQVLARIDNILEQLPKAIHQAHERIIGGRRVSNSEKILSLYEPDVHVIVRGKASGEVEFGNKLYIAEQRDGVLVDWELFKDEVPADNHLVQRSIERMKLTLGKPEGYVTDRGFTSKTNVKWLHEQGIRDGLCAKAPEELKQRRRDPWYAGAQKRRGNTEARIGIFKNVFLRGVQKEKGFDNRNQALIWSVLAHNLWVLARKSLADEANRLQASA